MLADLLIGVVGAAAALWLLSRARGLGGGCGRGCGQAGCGGCGSDSGKEGER